MSLRHDEKVLSHQLPPLREMFRVNVCNRRRKSLIYFS